MFQKIIYIRFNNQAVLSDASKFQKNKIDVTIIQHCFAFVNPFLNIF